jgi:predicted MPP superfamily phosphohydrolase
VRAVLVLLRAIVVRSSRVHRGQRNIALVFLGLGLALGGALLYARYVEPFRLTVRHHTVALAGLTRPLRVVLFSDVHSDPRFPVEDRLVATINGEQPDAIIFLGDALNAEEQDELFRQTLARLQAPTKLAIRGNWDVWFWSDIDLFAGTGFTELTSRWRQVEVRGVPLRVGAHEFVDEWLPAQVVPPPPPGPGPTILLYHATDYAHVAAGQGIDLYLDGDTHGGQIALPFYGPMLSVGRRGREFHRGLYHLGRTTVVVTPGTGVERNLPFRFGVPPEVTVLHLVPQPASGTRTGVATLPGAGDPT